MQSPPTRRTVLCVDDAPVILDLLKTVFRAKGYLAIGARNGQEALNIVGSLHVDAVVLDYFMPGMNGGEVAREMKRIQPQTPIILFSGSLHSLPHTVTDADAFVEKGDGMHALIAVVGRLLDSRQEEPSHVRKFRRFSANFPFVILAEREGRVSVLEGTCKDIGEGGLGAAVDGRLEPGERVLILLSDPRFNLALEPRAQVRYQNSNTCGFEFVDVTPDVQLDVRRLCQQLASA